MYVYIYIYPSALNPKPSGAMQAQEPVMEITYKQLAEDEPCPIHGVPQHWVSVSGVGCGFRVSGSGFRV